VSESLVAAAIAVCTNRLVSPQRQTIRVSQFLRQIQINLVMERLRRIRGYFYRPLVRAKKLDKPRTKPIGTTKLVFKANCIPPRQELNHPQI
jgi:hypothetical protein